MLPFSTSWFATVVVIVVSYNILAEEDGAPIFTPEQQVWIENLIDSRAGQRGVLTKDTENSSASPSHALEAD